MTTKNRLHRLQARGEQRYQQLLPRLKQRYKGRIVAIEPDSGAFVIGRDELQVALEAVKKFPKKQFAFFRIRYPAVHKVRRDPCWKAT